jgi:hypothetical protein
MIKKNITYIIVGLFLCWNVWLTLRQNSEQTTPEPHDYSIFDTLYQRHERRLDEIQYEMNFIDSTIIIDSIYVHQATRSERDSLREIYNPR